MPLAATCVVLASLKLNYTPFLLLPNDNAFSTAGRNRGAARYLRPLSEFKLDEARKAVAHEFISFKPR